MMRLFCHCSSSLFPLEPSGIHDCGISRVSSLTHLSRMDSSTLTLWTGSFPIYSASG